MDDGREDPRVVDSRARIRAAVLALVEERGLKATKVKDILARAAVARATFYAHFEDKEAAFVGGFDLLRIALPPGEPGAGPAPVPPLGPVFAHVAEMAPLFASVSKHGELELPLQVARRDLGATFRAALAELSERGFALAGPVEALAQAATAVVLALVEGWLEEGAPGAPEERARLAEDLVRRLVVGPSPAPDR
ncbi:MAG: helix-turn-helix domain-containing protein [Planctomycetota bacterium]